MVGVRAFLSNILLVLRILYLALYQKTVALIFIKSCVHRANNIRIATRNLSHWCILGDNSTGSWLVPRAALKQGDVAMFIDYNEKTHALLCHELHMRFGITSVTLLNPGKTLEHDELGTNPGRLPARDFAVLLHQDEKYYKIDDTEKAGQDDGVSLHRPANLNESITLLIAPSAAKGYALESLIKTIPANIILYLCEIDLQNKDACLARCGSFLQDFKAISTKQHKSRLTITFQRQTKPVKTCRKCYF